jgi:hypothetical protein
LTDQDRFVNTFVVIVTNNYNIRYNLLTEGIVLLRLCGMEKKAKVGSSGVITADELKIFVQLKMQMSGLTALEYAEKMGVPRQTIYAILNGDRLPSKALLKKLGIEVVYRITAER